MTTSLEAATPDTTTPASRFGLALWCAALASTLWFLHWLGSGDLATPPAPWRWGGWLRTVDPAVGVVALGRVGAIAASWYLVLVTVAGAVGRRARATTLVAASDRVTPGFLRSLLGSTGGLAVSAVGLTVAVAPLLAPAEVWPPEGQQASQRNAALRTVPGPVAPGDVSALLRRVNPDINPRAADAATPTTRLESFSFDTFLVAPSVGSPEEAATTTRVPVDVWPVETGDHLWHIAEDTLEDWWGRPVTEEETAAYWLVLIDHNRGQLVVPSDPDLIYPGQVFELPRPRPTAE